MFSCYCDTCQSRRKVQRLIAYLRTAGDWTIYAVIVAVVAALILDWRILTSLAK